MLLSPKDETESCSPWLPDECPSWCWDWGPPEMAQGGQVWGVHFSDWLTGLHLHVVLLPCSSVLVKMDLLRVVHSPGMGLGTAAWGSNFGVCTCHCFSVLLCVWIWTFCHITGHRSLSDTVKWKTKCLTVAAHHQMKMNTEYIYICNLSQNLDKGILNKHLITVMRIVHGVKLHRSCNDNLMFLFTLFSPLPCHNTIGKQWRNIPLSRKVTIPCTFI